MSVPQLFVALHQGGRAAVEIAMACATAGIIVSVVTHTGLGLVFTAIVTSVSQGNLPIALILVAIASTVLGMGLPTTAVYVLVAALAAPSLVAMGVHAFSAHMYAFYFGVFACVTPPIAIAAYAGATLAKGDINLTGWYAVRLSIVAYIIPFTFIYQPALLLVGTPGQIILAIFSATFSVLALAAGIQGWIRHRANNFERVLLFAAAIFLIKPGILTDIGGIGCLLIAGASHYINTRPKMPRD